MTDPVSELITDAVASTVLPDIATVAVRANMVEDAFSIGSLAVSVTFMVSPDFASVAFELQGYVQVLFCMEHCIWQYSTMSVISHFQYLYVFEIAKQNLDISSSNYRLQSMLHLLYLQILLVLYLKLLEDMSKFCFAGDVLSTRMFDEVRSDCVSVNELPA